MSPQWVRSSTCHPVVSMALLFSEGKKGSIRVTGLDCNFWSVGPVPMVWGWAVVSLCLVIGLGRRTKAAPLVPGFFLAGTMV